MTRELTTENSGTEYVQFRGRQTSVTLDDYPVVFEMAPRSVGDREIRCHEPYPVVGPEGALSEEEARTGDERGLWHELAEELVDTNPLVGFGVACELCDSVFDTPRGLSSHLSVHAEDEEEAELDETETIDETETNDNEVES